MLQTRSVVILFWKGSWPRIEIFNLRGKLFSTASNHLTSSEVDANVSVSGVKISRFITRSECVKFDGTTLTTRPLWKFSIWGITGLTSSKERDRQLRDVVEACVVALCSCDLFCRNQSHVALTQYSSSVTVSECWCDKSWSKIAFSSEENSE